MKPVKSNGLKEINHKVTQRNLTFLSDLQVFKSFLSFFSQVSIDCYRQYSYNKHQILRYF